MPDYVGLETGTGHLLLEGTGGLLLETSGVPLPPRQRALSDKGQDLLDLLPPYESDDPYVQTIIDAHARELQRIEDTTAAVLTTLYPGSATDQFRFLSMWESFLGLTVAPAGVSVTQRQQTVLASLRKRNAGAGSEWIDLLNQALGGTPWSYVEANPATNPYEVHIYVSSGLGELIDQIALFARLITPAHLNVVVSTGAGFFVGISEIGLESL